MANNGYRRNPLHDEWTCNSCMFRNTSNNVLCQMCENRKPPNTPKTESAVLSKLASISHDRVASFNFLNSAIPMHVKEANNKTPDIGDEIITRNSVHPKEHLQILTTVGFASRSSFREKNIQSGWRCQGCLLDQPYPPLDLVCPICQRKSPEIPLPLGPPRSKILDIYKEFTLSDVEDSQKVDKTYNDIIEFCQRNNQSFVDENFPHSVASLGDITRMGKELHEIVWIRPKNVRNRRGMKMEWTVFNDPQPTDIEQGNLGNCWFLSALAVIAERPEILERIVVTKIYNKYGIYKIRLCVDGLWETVFVDDFFPCDKNSSCMIFAVGRKNQLWVSLIEKALAKIYGSYTALRSGRTAEGFSILTGAPCEHIDLEVDLVYEGSEAAAALEIIWAKLLSARKANFLMGCSCGAGNKEVVTKDYHDLGLRTRHAYSILDVRDYGNYRLLRIRNPWGNFVWKGTWSPSWIGWNDEKLRRDFDHDVIGREPGTFWISFEDFCRFFDSLDIAFVRKHDRITVDRVDLLLLVHEDSENGNPGKLILNSTRSSEPCTKTKEKFLDPGDYVVFVLSFTHFLDEKNIEATMVIHSGRAIGARLEKSSPEALRQSLMKMILKEGKLVNNDIEKARIYVLNKSCSGLLIMAENHREDMCLHIKADCSQSQNIISSRGALISVDSIPPFHRQIIIILTHLNKSKYFVTSRHMAWKSTNQPKLGDFAINFPDSQHDPKFANQIQAAFHGPVPMYI
ncbi:hypothetical protein FO519_007503 [Halicephalobus sp. NKZ332]|nr:hypothetical protein FO519_007503 [Halicephalobus sp. NKZ332]